jgi:hypothetical protein
MAFARVVTLWQTDALLGCLYRDRSGLGNVL